MSKIDNGGPAFPVHGGGLLCGEKDDPRNQILQGGMTLRDWFAGQALQGILGTNYDWFTSGTETGSRTHEAAAFAYSLADAMIAARGERT